jgi:putative transposase
MARIKRTDVGGEVYHVWNRSNSRMQIFTTDEDYKLFEHLLEEAVGKFNVRLLAYSIMPNHWHLILYPRYDGDLAKFMSWLTNTHTRRWHVTKKSIGHGHLYQGRYKSFICQQDAHFISIASYVEGKAKRAKLVKSAQAWRWSSLYRRNKRGANKKSFLSAWPTNIPKNYLSIVNKMIQPQDLATIELAITKSAPYGEDSWRHAQAKKFNIEQTLRKVGRPKKGEKKEATKKEIIVEQPNREYLTKMPQELKTKEIFSEKALPVKEIEKNNNWFGRVIKKIGL